ncbi:OLC1v1019360C1 [Oldenlandia corymbosa var. corymbosa]|uniref:OLC1v1019360C1 n=1 Tax=Oldenlandia corymbosa var. corymbosa TaxID=529605 RepID=A0AAV1EEA0_OLDCO|nr:OLC1v1019360C1 [Oldenlandia corymbosa var. corymbosa]
MKMTHVNMGGVPFQTRSSQPIYVPEYSQDDLEEEDEDEEDEENEFDEDDVQDSVRMSAHHRNTPMYNLSSYPPPRYSSCSRPGPGGLPSPPTPIPSPMSGDWLSPHYSPSFPRPGQFPQGGGSQSRVSDEIDPTIWLVTDEVPGGPKDGSVIPSFLGHIAYHLWHGYNRPTLKIFKGEKILNKLKMWYKDMDDVVKGKIRGTGLGHLVHTSYEDIDLGLVKWEPFGHGQQGIVPRTIYSGWIMYRNLQEPYMSDRCICQIGYVQSIPRSPMSPDDAFRGPRTTQYFVEHSAVDTLSTWRRFAELACINLTRWRPNFGDIVGECEDGYLEWYRQYSHPFLLPTTNPSAVSTPARSSQWMNELRKLTTDLIKKVKVSNRELADEYDEKLQDTMIRYYKAP